MRAALVRLCFGLLLLLPFAVTPQAAKAQGFEVSFSYFHDQLAPYGEWRNSPRWGDVWVPNAGPDFRPYSSAGRWEDTTENGTVWVSDYEWGEIPFHYGRWVWDPDWQWIWVPGYVWGPGWVVWRSGDDNVGWFPMPPGDYDGDGIYGDDWHDYYGYRGWYGPGFDDAMFYSFWCFVPARYLFVNQINIYFIDYHRYHDFWGHTQNWTHYTIVNNIVVNVSININAHPHMFGDVHAVSSRTLFHRPITTFHEGRTIRAREASHFGAAQRANFKANFRNDFNRGKASQQLRGRLGGAGAGAGVTGAGHGAGGVTGAGRSQGQVTGKGRGAGAGAVTGAGRGAGGVTGVGRGAGAGAVTGAGRGAGGVTGAGRGQGQVTGKGLGTGAGAGAVSGAGRGAGGVTGAGRGQGQVTGKGRGAGAGAVTGAGRGAGGVTGAGRGAGAGAVTGAGRGAGGVTGAGRGQGQVTGKGRGQGGAGTGATQQKRGQSGQGTAQTQSKKKKCVGPNCPP